MKKKIELQGDVLTLEEGFNFPLPILKRLVHFKFYERKNILNIKEFDKLC